MTNEAGSSYVGGDVTSGADTGMSGGAAMPASPGGNFGSPGLPDMPDSPSGNFGIPASPDGYEFTAPEGGNAVVEPWAREMFHGAGLSKTQAARIYEGFMRQTAPILEQQRTETEAAHRAKAEDAARAADAIGERGMVAAKAAYARFVGDDNELGIKLEDALGDGAVIRFFHRVAREIGEDGKGALGLGGGSGKHQEPMSFKEIIAASYRK